MGHKEPAAVRVKETVTDHISVPLESSAKKKWKQVGHVF
jgi:hypothetical protein